MDMGILKPFDTKPGTALFSVSVEASADARGGKRILQAITIGSSRS